MTNVSLTTVSTSVNLKAFFLTSFLNLLTCSTHVYTNINYRKYVIEGCMYFNRLHLRNDLPYFTRNDIPSLHALFVQK